MEFSQKKDQTAYIVRQLIDLVNPDRLPDDSNLTELAIKLESNLNHLLREIKGANTLEDFTAINTVGVELCQTVMRFKPQFDAEHQRAENEEYEDEDEEYEDEDEEYEVEDAQNDRVLRVIPNQTPRAPVSQAPSLADLATRAAAVMATRKPCQFDHFFRKTADRRLYPVQYQNGPPVRGELYVYCCAAHNQAALEWIGSKGYAWANTEMLGEKANARV